MPFLSKHPPISLAVLLPYGHAIIAIVAQIIIFTLGFGVYVENLNPITSGDTPMMAALVDPRVERMQLLCSVVALPMVFELLVDIGGQLRSAALVEQDTAAVVAAAATVMAASVAPTPRLHVSRAVRMHRLLAGSAKEWVMRFLYIAALALPASVNVAYTGSVYRQVVYLTCFYMRLLTIFCMAMFTLSDSFDHTWFDYLGSLAVSAVFALAMFGEYTGQCAPQSSHIAGWYIFGKVLACVDSMAFIMRASYHSHRLARQVHNNWPPV